MLLLGISGLGGSGKDSLADYISVKTGWPHVSASRVVADVVDDYGFPNTRPSKRLVADNFRRCFGGHYWVQKAIESVKSEPIVIVSGIYSKAEARYFSEQQGIMVWVEAESQDAAARTLERSDGTRDLALGDNLEAVERALLDELEANDGSDTSVDLAAVKSTATHILDNSGSIENLHAKADILIDTLKEKARKLGARFPSSIRGTGKSYIAPEPWKECSDDILKRVKRSFFADAIRHIDRYHAIFPKSEQIADLTNLVIALNRPSFDGVTSNQIAKRMVDTLILRDPIEALRHRERIHPSSIEEDFFCGLRDELFLKLHTGIHLDWLNSSNRVSQMIGELENSIDIADKYQFSTARDRGLAKLQREGIAFRFMPAHLEELTALANEDILENLPLLEFVKNARFFEVSGFSDAKASLVVHDIIDHMWTFDLLERTGLLDRHARLFRAVGNPELYDVYRREGEMVASIAYGIRAFHCANARFAPEIPADEIIQRIRRIRGAKGPEYQSAISIVNQMTTGSAEFRSLAFVFSNYVTELDEQKSKFGSIKKRNTETGRVDQELDPQDPDYLCFFVETHHELLKKENKHRNAIFFVHYLLEDYLRSIVLEKNEPISISLKPKTITQNRLPTSSSIPLPVARWMFRNYGFTANRELTLS